MRPLQGLRHLIPFASPRHPSAPVSSDRSRCSVEPPNAPEREELLRLVRAFPWWYQRIYLGHGVFTRDAPGSNELLWDHLAPAIPDDLRGASVLDVGSNAGFFAIEMKRRNAGRVLGIETSDEHLRQAVLCNAVWGTDVEFRKLDAHDIESLGETFDIVLFTGILYHLRNPLSVLESVGSICRDAIVVETEVIVDDSRNRVYVHQGPHGNMRITEARRGLMKFIEGEELNGDPTNWWVPDRECVMGMLRTAGFRRFSRGLDLASTRFMIIAAKSDDGLLSLV